MKQKVLTVESESLRSYTESDDLNVGKLGNNAATRNIAELVYPKSPF